MGPSEYLAPGGCSENMNMSAIKLPSLLCKITGVKKLLTYLFVILQNGPQP